MFPASTHSFFMVGLLWAMDVRAEPSLIHTLPGSCGLSSLRDGVQTLPNLWAHSWLLGTLPRVVPVVSAPSEMRSALSLMGGGLERGLTLFLQGNSPKCPRGSFSFWEKSSCSILWLPLYKEGPDLSHSPPLQLSWGLSGSGLHAAQLSTLLGQDLWSPWVFHFVLILLPVTSGNQVSHSVAQALFGRGGGR